RARIESAIELRRIAGDDFAAKLLRQPDAQRGFPGSGGTYDRDDGRIGGGVHFGNSSGQARTTSSASTISASGRLPITWCRESFILFCRYRLLVRWLNIVIVGVAQFDVGAFEMRRQRRKRIRSANGRNRGTVQRFFPRSIQHDGLGVGNTS